MFNFCLFIFVFYAVSNSARAILFGNNKRKHKALQRRNVHSRAMKRRNNLIYINTIANTQKTGRKGKTPMRPVAI